MIVFWTLWLVILTFNNRNELTNLQGKILQKYIYGEHFCQHQKQTRKKKENRLEILAENIPFENNI